MYITIEELLLDIDKSVLTNLVDDENQQPNIDLFDAQSSANKRIVKAITDADSVIDIYLIKYNPPVQATTLIKKFSSTLSIKNLYERRLRENCPEAILQASKDVLKMLTEIKEGRLSIEPNIAEPTPSGFYKINKTKADKIFPEEF